MKRSTILTTSAALLLVGSLAHAQGDPGRGRGRGQDPKPSRPKSSSSAWTISASVTRPTRRRSPTGYAPHNRRRSVAATETQRAVHRQPAVPSEPAQQQQRLNTQRDVQRDPYYSAPMTFRYTVGSTDRETNRYGADVMRQAVNNGYQQGFKAGRADRRDHWSSNYQQSYGYQDANFGFSGNYLPQSDYNYYFREGFRRGYEDGFARHSQYGTVVNGSPSILGTILAGILGLHNIG